jgi:hypothetical protein
LHHNAVNQGLAREFWLQNRARNYQREIILLFSTGELLDCPTTAQWMGCTGRWRFEQAGFAEFLPSALWASVIPRHLSPRSRQ